jgi:hypothetical protein
MPEIRYEFTATGDAVVIKAADIAAKEAEEADMEEDR